MLLSTCWECFLLIPQDCFMIHWTTMSKVIPLLLCSKADFFVLVIPTGLFRLRFIHCAHQPTLTGVLPPAFPLASSFATVAVAVLAQQDVPKSLQTKYAIMGIFCLALVVEPIPMGSNLCCYHYQYKKPPTRGGSLYW